jgi:hypothetical protein
MDEDLDAFSREQLVAEVVRLRHAIRKHRDASVHELCWHHPDMWSLLPEGTSPSIVVPDWPQFMRGCIKYRQSLDAQAPEAPRTAEEFGTQGGA